MASTIVQVDGIQDAGFSLFLYALSGATGTPTATGYALGAVSGVPGRYTATVADALVGNFIAWVHDDQTEADNGSGDYGPGYVALEDTTDTYIVVGDFALSRIEDYTGYCLSILAGNCSDAGTAAETYAITINGSTYTVDYTGLDVIGNRTTTTLSKS